MKMIFALLVFSSLSAHAATRAIMIPGKSAILIMEGMSSAGADMDPRKLYDSMAMAPVQQSGGEGKIAGTSDKTFNFTCVTKNSSQVSVVCNIVIKPSPGSTIEFSKAEFHVGGAEALQLNQKFAGTKVRFDFVTSDGAMKIESTPEHFDFTYR